MANSCYNYVVINGNTEELKIFHTLLTTNTTDEVLDGYGIYRTLLSNFDKINLSDARWFDIDVHEFEGTSITLSGDSAWCPSLALFTAISAKFNSFEIRYEYDESGCNFAGWAEISKGICNDFCFDFWEGMIQLKGDKSALDDVFENELECFESKEDLVDSCMYSAFSEENQKSILAKYLEIYEPQSII